MYIDSINSQGTDYAISSFQETLINTQTNNVVKTIDFPSGYNLDSNLSFNIMFKNGHICSADNKPMTLNGKAIKVYSYANNTTLINLPMITVSSQIWTLKPNTSLELYYDGEQFIVVGNPIVYTTNDCDYYANGKVEYKKSIVTTQNKVNDSCNVLLQGSQIGSSGYYNVNTACGNTLTFNSGTGVLSANTFSGALNGKANSACSADNASKFNNKTYTEVKTDIQSSMVSMTNIGTNIYPLALCTGANTISSSSSLTFNASEGILSATKFCGSFCGTADNALSANDSAKFCGCTYQEAYADIRDGLTDCLGTVTWGNKSDSSAYPVTFCTNDNTIGVTSNQEHSFTYNPNDGNMGVYKINNIPINCVTHSIWRTGSYDCCIAVDNIFFSVYGSENYLKTLSFVYHLTGQQTSIKECDLAYVLEHNTCRLNPILECAYWHSNTWYSMSVSGFFEFKAVSYYEVCRTATGSGGKYIHKFHTVNGCTYTIDDEKCNYDFSLSFV